MARSDAAPILIFLAGAVLLAAGATWAWRWWRGRRSGETLYCRRCGYSLMGLTGSRCPECGAVLGRATVIRGELIRRPVAAVVGLAISLLGITWMVSSTTSTVRHYDWYTLKPTRWVIADAGSSNPATADRAWAEPFRRDKAGLLDGTDRDRVVELALKEQIAPAPKATIPATWLANQIIDDRLPDAAKQRFFEQCTQLSLRVRPFVILGDEVPYFVDVSGHLPNVPGIHAGVKIVKAGIDGDLRDVSRYEVFPRFDLMHIPGRLSGEGLGNHVAAVLVHTVIFRDNAGFVPICKRDMLLSLPIKVLAAMPERQTVDAGMDSRIRACVRPVHLTLYREPQQLDGFLEIRNCPMDLAVDVIVRSGGEELLEKQMTSHRNTNMDWWFLGNFPVDEIPFKVDVIIRGSDKVARDTVDFFDIWRGEIVFKDVAIESIQ